MTRVRPLPRVACALVAATLATLTIGGAGPAGAEEQTTIDVLRIVDGAYVVETVSAPARTAATVVDDLEAEADVVVAGPSVTYEVEGFPDPYWDQDGPGEASDVRSVWSRTRGEGQIVAVLDTGVDTTQPDLAGALVPGTDTIGGAGDPWHGTGVAGVVAARADNGIGGAGMAPEARIMPVRVCNDAQGCPSAAVASGILWAADHGADVINMSLSGAGYSDVSAAAVQYALDKNISVVASSGNDGLNGNPVMYPAANSGVIAVSSTDGAGAPSDWAVRGWQVDVSTVGDSVLVPLPGNSYGSASGTSFSGPAVAGAVALLRSAVPGIATEAVQAALQAGADSSGSWDRAYGAGRLQLPSALAAADRADGGVTVTPGSQSLTAAWDAVPGATGYTVRVDGVVRATAAGTTAQVTGLTDGTQVAVDVQADGGARSAAVLATVGPAAPGTPTISSGALRGTSSSAILDLQASTVGAPGTRLSVVRDGVSIGTFARALTSTPQTLSIGIGPMPPVETRWQLRAIDDLGRTSAASNAVTVGSGRPPAPGAVTGLAGRIDGDELLLTWDDVGTAYTYRVTAGGALVATPRTAGAVVPAPSTGVTVTYLVSAVDAWDQAGPAADLDVAGPGPATVPGAPAVGTATAGAASATVRWSAPVADGGSPLTGYTVQAFTSGTPAGTTAAAADATSVVVPGLTDGTPYTFSVTAANAVGTGAASAASSAVTPHADLAAQPLDLAVAHRLGNGGMNLWRMPMSEQDAGFGSPLLVRPLGTGGFSYDRSSTLAGAVGDVTGSDDGTPDTIIWHAGANGGALVWAVGGGPDSRPRLWFDLRSGGWSWARSVPMLGDVTGDGWDDLVVRHATAAGDSVIWVFPSDGERLGAPQQWGRAPGLDQRGLLADLDADGRDDLLIARATSSAGAGLTYDVRRVNADGTAFAATGSPVFTGFPSAGWSYASSRQLTGDLTGDGRADLVTVHAGANGGLLVWVHRNCTTSGGPLCFEAPTRWQDLRTGGWSYTGSRQVVVDTDADGDDDLVTLHSSGASPGLLVWRHESDSTRLLAPALVTDLRGGGWNYALSRADVG